MIHGVRGMVFDLDGTLVRSEHDYAATKAALGLPRELAILEGIATRPADEQPALLLRVDAWERELAARAEALPGAHELLASLSARGIALGVVTRNTRETAWATLSATGLARWFAPEWVLGRHDAAPKPAPDGILALVRAWSLPPHEVGMVGDFTFDLQAARAAEVRAIGYDPEGRGHLDGLADLVIRHLAELAT